MILKFLTSLFSRLRNFWLRIQLFKKLRNFRLRISRTSLYITCKYTCKINTYFQGKLDPCVTCNDFADVNSDVHQQCGIRGAWGAKHCSFRCKNANQFLFSKDSGNVKQRNFVCRCKKKYPQWPNSKGKICSWTRTSDRVPISPPPNPSTYQCRQPNHRLKQGCLEFVAFDSVWEKWTSKIKTKKIDCNLVPILNCPFFPPSFLLKFLSYSFLVW